MAFLKNEMLHAIQAIDELFQANQVRECSRGLAARRLGRRSFGCMDASARDDEGTLGALTRSLPG